MNKDMDNQREFLSALLGGLHEAFNNASDDEKQELLRLNGHNMDDVRNRTKELVKKYAVKARMERAKHLRNKFESVIAGTLSRIGQQSVDKLRENFESLLASQDQSEVSLRFRQFQELSENDMRIFVDGNSLLDELEEFLKSNTNKENGE